MEAIAHPKAPKSRDKITLSSGRQATQRAPLAVPPRGGPAEWAKRRPAQDTIAKGASRKKATAFDAVARRRERPEDQAAAAALASVGTEAIVFRICEAIW